MEAVKAKAGTLILIPGQDKRAVLSAAQAAARAHNITVLRSFGKGRDKPAAVLVAVNEVLHFKSGEIIGIDVDKARRDRVETVKEGPIARAAAEVSEEDATDKLSEQLAAEASAKAKEDAVAKAKLQDEAKAKWTAAPDLQKKYPDFAAYLASLDLA